MIKWGKIWFILFSEKYFILKKYYVGEYLYRLYNYFYNIFFFKYLSCLLDN